MSSDSCIAVGGGNLSTAVMATLSVDCQLHVPSFSCITVAFRFESREAAKALQGSEGEGEERLWTATSPWK
jgi:hypothetical protein